MACVDVETPGICRTPFRSGLQVCLQQRCTREQLNQQGVMPSLKSPATFHKQIHSLERARHTENVVKHKIKRRPECSDLLHMHVLQETQAEGPQLKRARLAQRSGPLELLEKNVLPINSTVKEALSVGEEGSTQTRDVYTFDEDSGDALSYKQLANQRPPPEELKPTDVLNPVLQSYPPTTQSPADFLKPVPTNEQPVHRPLAASQLITMVSPDKTDTALVKHSLPEPAADRSRGRKVPDGRPKVRKLKYHQYVPPDQKPGPGRLSADSPCGHLLQQHVFLQLQILGKQQQAQHCSYQAIPPATLTSVAEEQNISEAVSSNKSQPTVVPYASSAPTRTHYDPISSNPALPVNLNEMKVARLRQELRLRRLPISGTKAELIERLRPFQDSLVAGSPQGAPQSTSPTPPPSVSPTPSEPPGPGAEDEQLREKERQIQELKRRLQQERRRVEELRRELEGVERRGQEEEERRAAPALPLEVKQEEPLPNPHPGPPEAPTGSRILLPVSATALLLLSNNTSQQVFPACTTSGSGLGLRLSQAGAEGTQSFPNSNNKRGPLSMATPNRPIYRTPISTDHAPKAKDPPRYEEAVKQTRSLQAQVPIVTSQPMDDLFDILIESGEISPTVRHSLPSTPVTASISTLPINSALSRPPPHVQVAPPTPALHSALTPDPRSTPPTPVTLAADQQLQAFLEDTLSGRAEGAGPQTLHCPMLDSPMEDAPPLCPAFQLQVGGMDMEWLELPTAAGPGGVLGPVSPLGILSPDLLDGHGFQLHWD
ncbi:myocardin-related transcription factor B isoform X1 [Conger conger]|uniref:myocardin-related transcription factor B isoform X1 n=2 Tax=Conger conger TaxID=82655 RepID=UPI002A598F21|nr:myocardin-related transcription factor B isoform X1 [Conger conger]